MTTLPQTFDLHVHTSFCDGKHTPEEMVLGAMACGLETVGFSSHAPAELGAWCMKRERLAEYRAELLRLREKYAGRIRILIGLEMDYYCERRGGWDYTIGSVHALFRNGMRCDVDHSANITLDFVEKSFDGDMLAYCEAYYALMADVIRKTGADIIGHFDLVTKFIEVGAPIDTAHPRYIRAWKSAADALIRTGKPFEINTGAISRGYRNAPYPASDILHYIAKNGGRAILSSDTHAKENFAFRFDEAAALARETGIHLCTLSEALPGREF